jgi:hypothetical protein
MKNISTLFFTLFVLTYYCAEGQTVADLGTDYNGTTATSASSGVLMITGTTTYSILPSTSNEVIVSSSTSNVDSKYDDGSYGKKGTKYNYMQISSDGYIEIAVTDNSLSQLITSLKLNGTSGSTSVSISSLPVLFSDSYPFDEARVIGYNVDGTLPYARSGGSGFTISNIPDGCKSIRIYRQVALNLESNGLYKIATSGTISIGQTAQTPRIAYIKATLVKGPSQIAKFSINGYAGTIDQANKIILLTLPYGTNLTDLTPSVTLAGDATEYSPTGAVDFTPDTVVYTISDADKTFSINYKVSVKTVASLDTINTINSLTINGKQATIDNNKNTISYEFPKYVTIGEWPVTFTLSSDLATADFQSGSTMDFASGDFAIKVTAQSGAERTYTISATLSDKKTIAILSIDGTQASSDSLLVAAFKNYYVEYITAPSTTSSNMASTYKNYELIVLHSNLSTSNATAIKMRELVGIKPILNMKAYLYGSSYWNWGTVDFAGAKPGIYYTIRVPDSIQNHQIYKDVTFDSQVLACFSDPENISSENAVQYVGGLTGGNATTKLQAACHSLARIENYYDVVPIQEINLTDSAKYILLAFSYENSSYTHFNTNTQTMLKNAADYLTDPTAHYNYVTHTQGSETSIPTTTIDQNRTIVSHNYYDILGKRITGLLTGLVIERIEYNDGTIKNKKLFIK